MKLCTLKIQHFRNHGATTIECAPRCNVFLGDNGEGKTNILEAISYLCLTKSFYANGDSTALQIGKDEFTIHGQFENERGTSQQVSVSYTAATSQKKVLLDSSTVQPFSAIVGEFPVVILSPENQQITFGGPADRRRFLDIVISQASRSYFEELLEYRRILKQRNKILFDAKSSKTGSGEKLEPWNAGLVSHGSKIIRKRATFVEEFSPYLMQSFRAIVGAGEVPAIRYNANGLLNGNDSIEAIEDRFRQHMDEVEQTELRMRSTLTGPHRDELELTINHLDVRDFASQGQHKTLLIALKLAEFSYLQERCRETPLLLLDDIFSELDEHRAQKLLDLTPTLGQIFLTTTDERVFPQSFDWNQENRKMYVKQGTVSHAEADALIH